MENNKFPFGEAVKFGWQKTKENFWLLVAVTLIWIVINGMFNYFAKNFEKTMPLAYLIIQVCSNLVSMMITLGVTKIGLKVYSGEKFDISEMFGSYRWLLKYFLASLLYLLAVLVGLILLIVPGIILMVRMSFYVYLIVDKQMGPVEAIKESMRLTKGNVFNLFLFWFVLCGVILLGLLALIIGVIVAIPVTIVASVFVYRYLESKKPTMVV